jgi:hypothetical protein
MIIQNFQDDNYACMSYLTMKIRKVPTSWHKRGVSDCLKSRAVPVEREQLLKVEMLSLVSKYGSIYNRKWVIK